MCNIFSTFVFSSNYSTLCGQHETVSGKLSDRWDGNGREHLSHCPLHTTKPRPYRPGTPPTSYTHIGDERPVRSTRYLLYQ